MENGRNSKPMPHNQRDDYVTLLVELVIIFGAIILVLSTMLFVVTRAHGSSVCMTKSEARTAFPKSHLFWHDIRRHCWDNNSAHSIHYKGHKIAPEVLPVHAEVKQDLDANGDELTPYDEVMEKPQAKDDCCWPPLDERSFKSRWDEFPAQWLTK